MCWLQSQHIASTVLRNRHGMEVHLISTGAVVQRLIVPDSHGKLRDVVLGFDNPVDYNVSALLPGHEFVSLAMLSTGIVAQTASKTAGLQANF